MKVVALAAVLVSWVPTAMGEQAFSKAVSVEPVGGAASDAGIEVLGAVELARESPDGAPVTGLSGLAWDADEGLLYAVSDRGRLLQFRPRFDGGVLVAADYVNGFPLRGSDGRPLRGRGVDAEDLAVRFSNNGRQGDSELLVSFEQRPRVHRYAPDGRYLGDIPLPASIVLRERFVEPNHGLESLADHPVFGLVALSEGALAGEAPGVRIFTDMDGQRWDYVPAAIPASVPVAMESLDDGRLLVMERAFVSLFKPMVISLRVADPGGAARLDPRTLVTLDGAEGWLLDNFEGLARHRCERFFIVSDDNGMDFQRTLLVYFELPGLSEP